MFVCTCINDGYVESGTDIVAHVFIVADKDRVLIGPKVRKVRLSKYISLVYYFTGL